MTLFDLILIAVSLSMDAFAVSICKGLSVRKVSLQHAMICGVWFGGFQFLMPALGYFLGDRFAALLTKFGPWIAFVLLALIGANMIKESFGGDEQLDDDYSAKAMLPLAIATSIDAFAVGAILAVLAVFTVLAVFAVPAAASVRSLFAGCAFKRLQCHKVVPFLLPCIFPLYRRAVIAHLRQYGGIFCRPSPTGSQNNAKHQKHAAQRRKCTR